MKDIATVHTIVAYMALMNTCILIPLKINTLALQRLELNRKNLS
jgi:hypothetical protein